MMRELGVVVAFLSETDILVVTMWRKLRAFQPSPEGRRYWIAGAMIKILQARARDRTSRRGGTAARGDVARRAR